MELELQRNERVRREMLSLCQYDRPGRAALCQLLLTILHTDLRREALSESKVAHRSFRVS